MRGFKKLLPFRHSAHFQRLNRLDSKGFYDGFECHNSSLWREDEGNMCGRE